MREDKKKMDEAKAKAAQKGPMGIILASIWNMIAGADAELKKKGATYD